MAVTGSRRNAVRFELQDDLEMDRLQFSRNIIQTELGFSPPQLDYVFALPGKKTFEVIFTSYNLFEQCMERFHQKKDSPRLSKVLLIPLSEREPKTVTVIMYSEKVATEDIVTWLSYHCTVLRSMELRDEDGIRTGARRFYVRLRREANSDLLHHLPSTIQLGPIRGQVFYAGQPKTCRKCGCSSHLAASCSATYCRNCKSTLHNTKDCDQPMKCNLCGSDTHTFRRCPESYANKARQSNVGFDYKESLASEEPQDQPESISEADQQDSNHQDNDPEQPGTAGCTEFLPTCPNSAPVSTKDCRDLLDFMLADLPTPDGTVNTPHLVSQAPAGGTGVPPSSPPPPDIPLADASCRKRPQVTSEDSSVSGPDPEVWSDPLSTSSPFLDPQCLTAFSVATQMSGSVEEMEKNWTSQKKKKKKKKDMSPPMV